MPPPRALPPQLLENLEATAKVVTKATSLKTRTPEVRNQTSERMHQRRHSHCRRFRGSVAHARTPSPQSLFEALAAP